MAHILPAHLLIGDTLAPLEFVVTAELNDQYLYGMEEYHPRYLQCPDSRPAIVHPGLLLNMSNITRSPSFFLERHMAAIHAGDDAKFCSPVHLGERLQVTWHLVDQFEKRGHQYQMFDAFIVNRDNRDAPVLERRTLYTYTSGAEAGERYE